MEVNERRITLAQKMMLIKYGVKIYDNVRDTLQALDEKILDIGFTEDYNLLNKTGLKLDQLYDEIYEQNKYGDIED